MSQPGEGMKTMAKKGMMDDNMVKSNPGAVTAMKSDEPAQMGDDGLKKMDDPRQA